MWMNSLNRIGRRSSVLRFGGALALTLALAAPGFAGPVREFPDDAYYQMPSAPEQKLLDTLVGKPMPALQVDHWINGPITPQDMKGKVVVLDIFSTWCGPCIAAIPRNNEIYQKHKGDLLLIGVCTSDDGQDKLPDLAKDKKISYPVAQDPNLKTADAYHVQMFPTYVVVDRKGIVRAAGLTPEGMETAVAKLLAEK